MRVAAIKNFSTHKTSKIESGSQIVTALMDKHSFCGYDWEILNCEIGSFTSIANGVFIGVGENPIIWEGTSLVARQCESKIVTISTGRS